VLESRKVVGWKNTFSEGKVTVTFFQNVEAEVKKQTE